jgi:hypothetical protein
MKKCIHVIDDFDIIDTYIEDFDIETTDVIQNFKKSYKGKTKKINLSDFLFHQNYKQLLKSYPDFILPMYMIESTSGYSTFIKMLNTADHTNNFYFDCVDLANTLKSYFHKDDLRKLLIHNVYQLTNDKNIFERINISKIIKNIPF